MEELPRYLLGHLAAEIRAGCLRIHSKKLKGADTDLCLKELYDVCAFAMIDFDLELSEEVLCQVIPALVFDGATSNEWLPPGPPDQQYEDFKERLGGRIDGWRAHRAFTKKIGVGLLKIHAKKLEGADTDLCLREAYDICATASGDFEQELDDVLLCERIPTMVFRWATLNKWLPPGPPDQQYEDLKKRLSGRIAYWQAEALILAEKQKRRSRLRERLGFAKELKRLMKEPHEKIPERIVRIDLAEEYGIKPEEVTWDQIRLKLSCLDYPAIEVVPSDPATDDGQRRFGYPVSDLLREVPNGIREVAFDHFRLWLTKRQLMVIELDAAALTPPTAQPESHKAETIDLQIDRLRDECRLTRPTTPTEHAKEGARQGDPAVLAEPLDDDLAKRANARSEWLDQKLVDNCWTADTEIPANCGPTYNTIQRYRSGQRSSRDRYVRRLISMAFRCTLSEVPE